MTEKPLLTVTQTKVMLLTHSFGTYIRVADVVNVLRKDALANTNPNVRKILEMEANNFEEFI